STRPREPRARMPSPALARVAAASGHLAAQALRARALLGAPPLPAGAGAAGRCGARPPAAAAQPAPGLLPLACPAWPPPGGGCWAPQGSWRTGMLMPTGGAEHGIAKVVEEGLSVPVSISEPTEWIVPMECTQHWYRIVKNQRNALKPVENASQADCGPRKKHWRWYRDRRIKMRKKSRTI
ncbi:unnamed protein product, partial [Prorocentrum cordatum]